VVVVLVGGSSFRLALGRHFPTSGPCYYFNSFLANFANGS